MSTGDGAVVDGLEGFLPAVTDWFHQALGTPTDPQRRAWPEIAAGRHTLICAPTGSGKTLAAFLACLDHLWRQERTGPGVRLLYISPLKALNEDIARNLEAPLAGIVAASSVRGEPPLPALRVAVRTGDTPPAERQRIARKPPDILITTPESLHLMLTSKARECLRRVSHVIVDEIHALAPNKRGVFLALLLERLEALNPSSFVRIGLSATQRPLDEVARFLGGRLRVGPDLFEPRPVSIIDAGLRKSLDLEVSLPATPLPNGSVWPAIEERLGGLIDAHRSTIVFTNNRRVAERLTARLNEREPLEEGLAGPDEDANPTVVSHHGSLSLERRRAVESALKSGTIRAVVATASLELGIDMGAVDLVCQVESPGSVARGLQRVGRAGHLVGARSRGRLLSKTAGDLLESAALAKAMIVGEVEPLRVPINCLDVLAQQIVACVAQERPSVLALFDLVRGAYPYRDLTASAFESVLELVSGRFAIETFRDLRPRISWDRVHNTLHPLPGTSQLALVGGGTIPDTGQFPLYLGETGPRLGELDEEFVLERRVGETFVLGTATWRIESIDAQRVVVSPAEGRSALLPFWRGEASQRSGALGAAVGALCREVAERIDDPDILEWLRREYHLDARSSRVLRDHIARQLRLSGAVPDDRTVLVETFLDPAGELALAVLTPWGGALHHALKLALQASLRRRLGIEVAALHHDEGILLRLPQMEEPPLDLFDGLVPERAERFVREELAESALFGLRFRQNAGRALLLPRPDPGKRTPLWLQRLRAKDLLQAVRQFPDFPIVIETFRECLNDDLDLPRLREVLGGIADGSIRVATRRGEIASPFASGLIFAFSSKFLYEWDEPKRARGVGKGGVGVSEESLDAILDRETVAPWLDPAAIGRVEGRLRESGRPPRTEDEMAERLRLLGDLTATELSGPMAGFLERLEQSGRAVRIALKRTTEPERWVDVEDRPIYESAFGASCVVLSSGNRADREASPDPETARSSIVRRFLRTHALIGLAELAARYPIAPDIAAEQLDAWAEDGQLVRVDPGSPDGAVRWADRRNLQEVRRIAVALRRRESVAVAPEVFAGFVLRRQHVATSSRLEGAQALPIVLEGLSGFPAPPDLLERDFLPRRLRDYRPAWLDEVLATGGWTWRASPGARGDLNVSLFPREFAGGWPEIADESAPLDPETEAVWAFLRSRGASFADDVAREVGLAPGAVRGALRSLVTRGMITNDRFDPVRAGGDVAVAAAGESTRKPGGRPRLGRPRRSLVIRPEGRWSVIARDGNPDEESALAWAEVLLSRYGVLTRETAAADPGAPPWRELAPVLASAELRGELRRGYYVEGLSGVQYALPEAVEALSRLAGVPDSDRTPVLVNSLDPANLYGIGAPLDIPLLEGGTARLSRNATNFLVLVAGRPVLIIENFGKRLTGLASASESELREAVALLPALAGPSRRVLKVETYNLAATLASPAAPWLADLGFVRDPPGMAYYAGWS